MFEFPLALNILIASDRCAPESYPNSATPEIPLPQGGGGTSFVPFFDKIGDRTDRMATGVCVYLTDGYGTFPDRIPELPVLWVVPPGCLDLSEFPFGEAVRLLINS